MADCEQAPHAGDDGAAAEVELSHADIEPLFNALCKGFSEAELLKCKQQRSPLNVLVEVGTARNASAVSSEHFKRHKDLVKYVVQAFPEAMPSKPLFRAAFMMLDEQNDWLLSQARKRVVKGVLTGLKTDCRNWAKDQGDSLSKIMFYTKKLAARSSKSPNPDLQEVKLLFRTQMDVGGSEEQAMDVDEEIVQGGSETPQADDGSETQERQQ